MKIKKIRLHSPKGSTVASVEYLDTHANDYDNTNVWVKPSDIWDPNKTVSELLAMPDVNDGYIMLPGMYKLGYPFKNKKNYDEVKGGILDIYNNTLMFMGWDTEPDCKIALSNTAAQHRLYRNGNELTHHLDECQNIEMLQNTIVYGDSSGGVFNISGNWGGFHIKGSSPINGITEALILDAPNFEVGKDYMMSYGVSFDEYWHLFTTQDQGMYYPFEGSYIHLKDEKNNYYDDIQIFTPKDMTAAYLHATKIKISLRVTYNDGSTEEFASQQMGGVDHKILMDVWYAKINFKKPISDLRIIVRTSNDLLDANGYSTLGGGLDFIIYDVAYFCIHDYIPTEVKFNKESKMSFINDNIKIALGKEFTSPPVEPESPTLTTLVTAVDIFDKFDNPTKVIVDDQEVAINDKLNISKDVHGVSNIVADDVKLNLILNDALDPLKDDFLSTAAKIVSDSGTVLKLNDNGNLTDIPSLVAANLGILPYKFNHSNIREYSGLISNKIPYTRGGNTVYLNIDTNYGIGYRLIIPAPYFSGFKTFTELQNGDIPVDHIQYLPKQVIMDLYGVADLDSNIVDQYKDGSGNVMCLVYTSYPLSTREDYNLIQLALFLEAHPGLELQAFFLIYMSPQNIIGHFGESMYNNGVNTYTINKAEIDSLNASTGLDIRVSKSPVYSEENDVHIEYELSGEDSLIDIKAIQVAVDKGTYVDQYGIPTLNFAIAVSENGTEWLTVMDTNQGSIKPIIFQNITGAYFDYAVVNLDGFVTKDPELETTTVKTRYIKIGIPDNNMYTRDKLTGVLSALNQKGLYLRGLDVKGDSILDYSIVSNGGATLDNLTLSDDNLKSILKKAVKDTRHDIKISQDMVIDLGSEKDISMVAVTLGKYAEDDKYEGGYTISISSDNTSYSTILTYSPTNVSPEQYLQASKIKPGDAPWDTTYIPEDNNGYGGY